METFLIKFSYKNGDNPILHVWHVEYILVKAIDFQAACEKIKKRYFSAARFYNQTILV